MRNKSYLRLAAAAVFLAAAAYGGAAFLNGAEPKPVTAIVEAAPVSPSLTLDGTVLRQEIAVTSPFSPALLLPAEGEYLSGGSLVCIPEDDADAYFAYCDGVGAQSAALCAADADGYGGDCVFAPCSGYFCADTDGLEGAVPEDYPELSRRNPKNAVGRIVYGASWYFVADRPDAELFEGQRVTLSLAADYPATVQEISDGRVIFRVREGLYSVLYMRRTRAVLSFPGDGGMVLPKTALHGDGDDKYVYTVSLGLAKKTPVEILYSDGDAVTVRSEVLHVGDEIVVSGENIYEGRVIEG